jgi:hypothetical protein
VGTVAKVKLSLLILPFLLSASACGDDGSAASGDDAAGVDGGSGSDSGCTIDDNTTASSTVAPSGCAVLERDASACEQERTAAGITGAYLKFSCRVKLTMSGGTVTAVADGQPDYTSNYYPTSNACYAAYTGAVQNPNHISTQSLTVGFTTTPNEAGRTMMGAIVGLAINGVPIFSNFAAPGDDIYKEAMTFDECGGHPQNTGVYHYHAEPFSLSYDDGRVIGMMRDGYAVYGRRDMDGSMPTLDQFGGHTGTTPDSATAVYHYHVNQQTSTTAGTAGEKQWFLTTGTYRGTPGTCTGC